ncbi:uncharacterized protein [Malus domestica]|uniref:uncharacterized protein isoform X2 n=1 Tax=Malus domestica TaxID=3750 RepID=UPI0039754325
MSSYENVVGGKLKLKGKALDVKAAGMKKKKKHKKHQEQTSSVTETELSADGSAEVTNPDEEEINDSHKSGEEGKAPHYGDLLTPAERRYIEQRERIDNHRLAKTANKSHRDRIQDFNQYLANMSEHYDIPKVGPG